jgi:hypothetical protein
VVIPLCPQLDSLDSWYRSVLVADMLGRLIIPQNVNFIYNNFVYYLLLRRLRRRVP